jgi:hypothetical protein
MTKVCFLSKPLEKLNVRELTDVIGIKESAALFNTSVRAIYTMRNTNSISIERLQAAGAYIKANEAALGVRWALLETQRELRAVQAAKERAAVAA